MNEEKHLTPPPGADSSGSGNTNNNHWRVIAHNSRVDKNWQDLVQRVPSDCRRSYAHLTQHPLQRDRGRAFPMLGDHKPAWEYRVNGSDRVFYVVFPKEKKVRVYYAGPHYRGRRPPLPPVRP